MILRPEKGDYSLTILILFLKFKQEASGPPDWIKTEDDVMTYIDQYFEKEGVSLELGRTLD